MDEGFQNEEALPTNVSGHTHYTVKEGATQVPIILVIKQTAFRTETRTNAVVWPGLYETLAGLLTGLAKNVTFAMALQKIHPNIKSYLWETKSAVSSNYRETNE